MWRGLSLVISNIKGHIHKTSMQVHKSGGSLSFTLKHQWYNQWYN